MGKIQRTHLGLGAIGTTSEQGGYTGGVVYNAAEQAEKDQAVVDLVQEVNALKTQLQDLRETNGAEKFVQQVLQPNEAEEAAARAKQEYYALMLADYKKRKFEHPAQIMNEHGFFPPTDHNAAQPSQGTAHRNTQQ